MNDPGGLVYLVIQLLHGERARVMPHHKNGLVGTLDNGYFKSVPLPGVWQTLLLDPMARTA